MDPFTFGVGFFFATADLQLDRAVTVVEELRATVGDAGLARAMATIRASKYFKLETTRDLSLIPEYYTWGACKDDSELLSLYLLQRAAGGVSACGGDGVVARSRAVGY